MQIWSEPRCEYDGVSDLPPSLKLKRRTTCKALDATPMFTRSLKENGDKQPKFYCDGHAPLFRHVSPTSGQVLREAKRGKETSS
jgi:hypothetical protein